MMHGTERELQRGQVIAERYRIEAPIGRGAMGAVWRAVHVTLESPVAIKFLNAAIADEPTMLDRFMREAQSAAAVRSSHVVQIFDYGVDRGVPYIAMELLVGEPLDVRLDRGALAPPELDKIFDEVARAVGVAHELGVVHRDIKPANIFIAREGGRELTKVLDFGIAKLVDQRIDAPAGSGTHTGIILGTPNYMSPEQARGQRRVDHRSDLWSLAILAFECLTGRQPFESSSLGDLVVKICTAEPLVPSAVATVPPAFDAWFARGASKDPAARFHSAGEMAEALHALLAAEGLIGETRSPRSTPARLALVSTEVIPAGVHAARVGSASAIPPAPHEPSERSMTAKAVSTEVLARPRPALRRKLAVAAIPLAALIVALAAAFVSGPPPRPSAGAQALPAPPVAAALTPSVRVPSVAERSLNAPSTTAHGASAPAAEAAVAGSSPSSRVEGARQAADIAEHAASVARTDTTADMNRPSALASAAAGGATSASRAASAVATRSVSAAAGVTAAARGAGAVLRDAKRSPGRSQNDVTSIAPPAPSVAPPPVVDPYADRL